MKLLIGFVNQFFTPLLNLGVLDLDNESFQWIFNEQIARATTNVQGVNGLSIYRDHIFVGYQSNPTKILIFNTNFEIINELVIPEIKQLHSFTFIEDKIYCVSTGTGEIFELQYEQGFNIKEIKCIYRVSNFKEDRVHLNSICVHNGELISTCFGKKINGSWRNSKNGRLFYIRNNETILDGLFQPHSAHTINGQWVVCESGTGNLIFQNSRKVNLGGYIRGIAHDDFIYVGLSGKRIKSRSKGTLNIGVSNSLNDNKSFIKILDKKKLKVLNVFDVSVYGTEIFDLEILPSKFEVSSLNKEPIKLQLEHLENRIVKLEKQLQEKKLRKILLKKLKFFKKLVLSFS